MGLLLQVCAWTSSPFLFNQTSNLCKMKLKDKRHTHMHKDKIFKPVEDAEV